MQIALGQGDTFFDILEEVIKEKTTVETVVGFKGIQGQRQRSRKTNEPMNKWTDERQSYQKKHTYRAKGGIVEESKKGYTGDALALRGDEGRDKLR